MEPLEAQIGYIFKNRNLLEEALTHPSLAYETQRNLPDNQRLEYLGDAVLELIFSDYLYATFPKAAEGLLTKLRARVVSRPALADYARKLSLGTYLKMGRGEETSGGRKRDSSLADGMEALTAAVYLDGGWDAAKTMVLRVCEESLAVLKAEPTEINPKGQLQEILQGMGMGRLKYIIIKEDGPDHQKNFVCRVEWNGEPLGEGEGSSKKEAETAAAKDALAGESLAQFSSTAA
jgi:ribonuclease-3